MIETTRKALIDIASQLDEASDAGMMGMVGGFLIGIARACDCLEEMIPLAAKITVYAAKEIHEAANNMATSCEAINDLIAREQVLAAHLREEPHDDTACER